MALPVELAQTIIDPKAYSQRELVDEAFRQIRATAPLASGTVRSRPIVVSSTPRCSASRRARSGMSPAPVPMSSNDTVEGRARNRRVEIFMAEAAPTAAPAPTSTAAPVPDPLPDGAAMQAAARIAARWRPDQ